MDIDNMFLCFCETIFHVKGKSLQVIYITQGNVIHIVPRLNYSWHHLSQLLILQTGNDIRGGFIYSGVS